jgi:hypothetical protein
MAIRGDELTLMSHEDILRIYYGKSYKKMFEEKKDNTRLAEKEFGDSLNANPTWIPRAIGLRGCLGD